VLGPLLLIVLGVLFLLNNLYPGMFRFGRMWPVILIVIGLAKVLEYFQAPRPPDTSTPDAGKPDASRPDASKEGQ
jgi:hypothetical protein